VVALNTLLFVADMGFFVASAHAQEPPVDAVVARLEQVSMHEAAYVYLIEQAFTAETPEAQAHYELWSGMTLVRAEDWSRAASHFQLLPDSSGQRLGLAWSLFQDGSAQPALRLLSPDVPAEAYMAGWCALSLKQPAEALQRWSSIPVGHPLSTPAASVSVQVSALNQIPYRSPAVAGVLAAGLPGAGHAYAGHWGEAASAFFVNGALIAAGWQLAHRELWFGLGLVAFVEFGFYGGNIVSAVGRAKRFNRLAWQRPVTELQNQYTPQLLWEEGEVVFR
jgi:hypothetical protein